MFSEFLQTVCVDVLDDTGSASCDLTTLLQAIDLARAVGVGLAHHVVVIEGLASCTDEEGG